MSFTLAGRAKTRAFVLIHHSINRRCGAVCARPSRPMECWIARQLGTIASSAAAGGRGAWLIHTPRDLASGFACVMSAGDKSVRGTHSLSAAPKNQPRKTMRTRRLPSICERQAGYKYLFASTWRACDKSFVLLTSQPPNTFYCELAEWKDELHAYFQPPRVLIGAAYSHCVLGGWCAVTSTARIRAWTCTHLRNRNSSPEAHSWAKAVLKRLWGAIIVGLC
jgi:hypothetical protein